jgi:hypothetical protein
MTESKQASLSLLNLISMCIWVLWKAQPRFYVKVRYGKFRMYWRMALMKHNRRKMTRKEFLKLKFRGLTDENNNPRPNSH